MNSIVAGVPLPPTSASAIDYVRTIEKSVLRKPQIKIRTEHVLHAGIYTRTICVPAQVMAIGALIKIPTTLTVSGHALVIIGDKEEITVEGFMVMAASAGRKQVVVAHTDTYFSMSFRTDARNVGEAEKEFTDETDMLKSRDGENAIMITDE